MKYYQVKKRKGDNICEHDHGNEESASRLEQGLPVPPPHLPRHRMRWRMNIDTKRWEAICERDDVTFYCPMGEEEK